MWAEVINATTGTHLVELLESKTDAIITTVINKFETAVKRIKHPLTDPNIFILIDEAHRSQYKKWLSRWIRYYLMLVRLLLLVPR